jgi:hypothetical protein
MALQLQVNRLRLHRSEQFVQLNDDLVITKKSIFHQPAGTVGSFDTAGLATVSGFCAITGPV